MISTSGGEPVAPSAGACHRVWLPVLIAALFVIAVYVLQTSRSVAPDHGDIYTDLELTLQGERLAKAGPANLRYGSVLDEGHLIGLPPFYYANWPETGPLLVAYTYLRGRSLIDARTAMLLFAGLSLILFYRLVLRLGLGPRAALAGILALACAAPFHILADTLSYFMTDTFGRLGVLLCILAAIREGSARIRLAALAGMFLSIVFLLTMSGYEAIPAIGLYAFLLPLVTMLGERKSVRIKKAAVLCLNYGAAVAAGICLRFENAASILGSAESAKNVLVKETLFRISPAPAPVAEFIKRLVYRLGVYYQWHLTILVAIVAVCGWHYLRRWDAWRRFTAPFVAIAAIGLSDCAWLVLVRQHTFIHTHTIHQIGPAICLLVALAVAALLDFIPTAARGFRAGSIAVLSALGLLAFLNIGLVAKGSEGNLLVRYDWMYRLKMFEPVGSVIPSGSILVSGVGQQPEVEYSLRDRGLVYINRALETLPLESLQQRHLPVYIMTWRKRDDRQFADCMRRFQLVLFNLEFAIFRAVERPELNLALLPDAGMRDVYTWNQPMWAFALYPAAGMGRQSSVELPLPPAESERLRLWVTAPQDNLANAGEIALDVKQLDAGDRLVTERTILLDPSVLRAARGWISYPLGLPDPSGRKLRVLSGCGKPNTCGSNLVYAFLSLDQT